MWFIIHVLIYHPSYYTRAEEKWGKVAENIFKMSSKRRNTIVEISDIPALITTLRFQQSNKKKLGSHFLINAKPLQILVKVLLFRNSLTEFLI